MSADHVSHYPPPPGPSDREYSHFAAPRVVGRVPVVVNKPFRLFFSVKINSTSNLFNLQDG